MSYWRAAIEMDSGREDRCEGSMLGVVWVGQASDWQGEGTWSSQDRLAVPMNGKQRLSFAASRRSVPASRVVNLEGRPVDPLPPHPGSTDVQEAGVGTLKGRLGWGRSNRH